MGVVGSSQSQERAFAFQLRQCELWAGSEPVLLKIQIFKKSNGHPFQIFFEKETVGQGCFPSKTSSILGLFFTSCVQQKCEVQAQGIARQ